MFLTEEHNWLLGALLFALRYYFLATVFFFVFYVWRHKKLIPLKFNPKYPSKNQLKTEFLYTACTFIIYAASASLLMYWYQNGWTKIYLGVDTFGYLYLFFSILLMLLVHDSYFYWTHKLMHSLPFLYRFHRIHHRSHNPNPWSAFSFHPVEAIISLGFVPIIVFFIPVHPLALTIFFTIMTTYNILIHLGYRISVAQFKNQFQNTAENHELHHQKRRYNYGFYFSFWDRLMKTYK